MNTITLSSKGQITIPQHLCEAYGWHAGMAFLVVDTGDGILLKPKRPLPVTTLEDVAGCLAYEGNPKTLAEMDKGIKQGVDEGK